jgi:ribosomal 50S subunit-recycling heat shock protein
MADKLGHCPSCKARMVSKTMCEHGHVSLARSKEQK